MPERPSNTAMATDLLEGVHQLLEQATEADAIGTPQQALLDLAVAESLCALTHAVLALVDLNTPGVEIK